MSFLNKFALPKHEHALVPRTAIEDKATDVSLFILFKENLSLDYVFEFNGLGMHGAKVNFSNRIGCHIVGLPPLEVFL